MARRRLRRERRSTTRCSSATTSTSTSRTRSSACPASATSSIFGERKYAMRLWLDPDRLAARGITAGDVVNALREQNVQVAAGSLGQAPAPRGADVSDQRARRRPADARPREFENIILKTRRRRRARPAQGRRPRRARRRDLRARSALPRRSTPSASACIAAADGQRARRRTAT